MTSQALTPERRRLGLILVGLAGACVSFALAIQMGLNANFMADEIGVSGLQLGMLEAVRESCGILALLVLALLAGRPEPVVGAGMLLLVAAGLSGYAVVRNYGAVLLMSLVWSQGLHVWMPLPASMTMGLAEPGRTGFRLGQVRSAGSAGFGIGLAGAYILTRLGVPMRPQFLVAGAAAAAAAAACIGIPREIRTPGPRLVFRRQYGLYYLLSFLEGWRKQIFICFAGFLLVREYGAPLQTILLLLGAVQVVRYVAAPRVGRLIDRVGERPVLITYFAGLALFFIGYATVRVRAVLYVLFVLDNAFFVLSLALSTYVNRLVPPGERTPTLSMGVAMNHVAAVIMPLLGGVLWKYAGYQWVFAVGALAAAGSVVAARRLPVHHPVAAEST
ncbi:MAG: MFS transporter [Kiritimatiellaeota bacterium]|nr:MFS transporter [Kiritimatiellota bacterium]